jgi:DNA polymerase-3 subunit epsilon
MRVLVFDTETTGLPTSRRASYTEVDKWPHIVQLSFALYDTDTGSLLARDYIISLPDGVRITPGSQKVHGISEARCRRHGVPLLPALEEFVRLRKQADIIVAHNLSFDKRVLLSSAVRAAFRPRLFGGAPEYCTMESTKDIPIVVAVNSRGPYNKYPTLVELHRHLFEGESPRGMHDSLADVLICLRCYVMLTRGLDIVPMLPPMYREYAF